MNHREHYSDHGSQSAPSNAKGKEPASLASRIASSASGLARDAVGRSGANELRDTFSNGTGMSSKVLQGSSSSIQSGWIENLPSRPAGANVQTFARADSASRSFRSSPIHESQNAECEEFLGSSQSVFSPALTNGSQSPESWTNEFHHRPLDRRENTASSHYLIDYDDGAEVRLLLSDSNLNMESDFMDIDMPDGIEETAKELFSREYSPGEQQAANRIRSSLPTASVHRPISSNSVLDLRFADQEDTEVQMGFTEAFKSYVDDVWGPFEKSVWESLENGEPKQEKPQLGHASQENQALSRLRMILGHVAEMTNSELSSQQAHSQSQASFETANQAKSRDTLANAHGYGLLDTTRLQHQAIEYVHGQDIKNAEPDGLQETRPTHDRVRAHKMHQQPTRRDSPMEQDTDEERSTPTFHCPWILCHQRFNNATELRLHTSVHTQYACPHEDCTAQFQSHEEWADHITGPHHDLIEASFRSTPVSEDE